MPWPVRVLVVEDSELMLAATSARLRNEPDIQIVGEASDRSQALQRMKSIPPDIVLLDLRLGGSARGGADLAAVIGARFPSVEIVVYSDYVADRNLAIPGATNVKGCVLKTDPPGAVVDAIRTVARGGRYSVPKQVGPPTDPTR